MSPSRKRLPELGRAIESLQSFGSYRTPLVFPRAPPVFPGTSPSFFLCAQVALVRKNSCCKPTFRFGRLATVASRVRQLERGLRSCFKIGPQDGLSSPAGHSLAT